MSDASATELPGDLEGVKPRFRGVSHHIAFFFAIAGCAALLAQASNARVATVAAVYGVTLMTLFGISALYHRPMWGRRGRSIMRRLDHASIFIFIAGCYTPICILGLPPQDARNLLTFVWLFAAAGAVHAVFFLHLFRTLNAVLFVAMGCAMIPYVPQLAVGVGTSSLALLLGGGAIYIAGAVVYSHRWPNPAPAVFGYHEVFHLMVILACSLHYAALFDLVSSAA